MLLRILLRLRPIPLFVLPMPRVEPVQTEPLPDHLLFKRAHKTIPTHGRQEVLAAVVPETVECEPKLAAYGVREMTVPRWMGASADEECPPQPRAVVPRAAAPVSTSPEKRVGEIFL